MKETTMSKLSNIAAGLAVMPVFAFTTAVAGATGQVGAGDIYRVRNVTANPAANAAFANTTEAKCGDVVQFRVRIHNSGPDAITNVKVKATLEGGNSKSHGSTVTVSADNLINGDAVTDIAGVSTNDNTTISYVNGSTELLGYSNTPGNSPVLGGLPDGIVSSNGITLPDSIEPLTSATKSVQFKAKLNCETPPTTPPKDIKVCELKTKNVITIKENEFDSAKHTKDLSKCNATPVTTTPPTELVKTGPAGAAAVFAVVAAVAALGYNVVLRRQNGR
jgi:uncharacterized repeat protein (TIGR01451 family)